MSAPQDDKLRDVLRPMTPEELANYEGPTDEEIAAALEKGRKLREEAQRCMGGHDYSRLNGIYFK